MRIIINEQQQQKLISELSGEFKEGTEIIYQDHNIITMIPKTQMSSAMFGKGTKWCQVDAGFKMWSQMGLLIRFLFRGGRKIRFTCFFNTDDVLQRASSWTHGHDYYWANENGAHVLFGDGNPFDVVPEGKIHDTERDILKKITEIPDECKNKVLSFIEQHRNTYDYCYNDKIYLTRKKKIELDRQEREYREYQMKANVYDKNVWSKYYPIAMKLRNKDRDILIDSHYSDEKKAYLVKYSFNAVSGHYDDFKNDYFDNMEDAEKKIIELIKYAKTLIPKGKVPNARDLY